MSSETTISNEQENAEPQRFFEEEEQPQHPPPPMEDEEDDDDDDEDDDDVIRNSSYQQQQQSAHEHQMQHDDEDLHEPEEQEEYTSIWDIVGNYSQSPLDNMLKDSSNVTLAQVLDEDTLAQEVKACNAKVLEFLNKEHNIKQMLEYLTTDYLKNNSNDKDEDYDDEQVKTMFKFPYVVTEVICCELDEINEHIVAKEEHVNQLFAYLVQRDKGRSLVNPFLPQYVVKCISCLLQKHYIPITNVLLAKEGEGKLLVEKLLVEQVELAEMDVFTLKMLGIESPLEENNLMGGDAFGGGEFGSAFGSSSQQRVRELFLLKQRGNDKQLEEQKKRMQQWVLEQGLFGLYADRLEKQEEDVSRNIFSCCQTIVEKGGAGNMLQAKILSKEFLGRIMDVLLATPSPACFVQATSLLKTVIETSEVYSDGVNVPEAISAIHSRTSDFVQRLQQPHQQQQQQQEQEKQAEQQQEQTEQQQTEQQQEQQTEQQEQPPQMPLQSLQTSFGLLNPPLGEERLKIIDHLSLLFRSTYASIHNDLIQHKALQVILNLFFHYSFNSMLHVSVFRLLTHIIEQSNSIDLKKHLIQDCDYVQMILEAHARNEQSKTRLGYMGHLIDLSNMLRKASLSQAVFSFLASTEPVSNEKQEQTRKLWQPFVEGPLAQMNIQQEKQLGGTAPNGASGTAASLQDSMFQFDNDDDDDEFLEEDSDSGDDSGDDEVVVKKSENIVAENQ